MAISIWYLAPALIILGGAYWFWASHTCYICHKFHHDLDLHHFIRCRVCNKLFCKYRITRYEVIEEKISGKLGNSTKIIERRNDKFRDYPCGLEYITTQYRGSSYSHFYCVIHDPSNRDLKRLPLMTIATAPPLRILSTKPPYTRGSLQHPKKKLTINLTSRRNKDKKH